MTVYTKNSGRDFRENSAGRIFGMPILLSRFGFVIFACNSFCAEYFLATVKAKPTEVQSLFYLFIVRSKKKGGGEKKHLLRKTRLETDSFSAEFQGQKLSVAEALIVRKKRCDVVYAGRNEK